MAETFREFYKRTTGVDYAGGQYERAAVVNQRIADALADWADEIARRVALKPLDNGE